MAWLQYGYKLKVDIFEVRLDIGVGEVDLRHSCRYIGVPHHFLEDKRRRLGKGLAHLAGMLIF